MDDRDKAYEKFVSDKILRPSLRETFNSGWHAALAAVRADCEPTIPQKEELK